MDQDKPSGNGTISYANGTEYVGILINGVPNGHGIKTTFDGDRYEGEWKDGKEWNLKVYNKNDKLISRVIFGVEQPLEELTMKIIQKNLKMSSWNRP